MKEGTVTFLVIDCLSVLRCIIHVISLQLVTYFAWFGTFKKMFSCGYIWVNLLV